ncbi:2211_t:CDS:2, partial [Gigaspora margarita]
SLGKNNIQNGNPAISGENSTPNRNSEIPLELKKFLNAIQEERKKW